MNLPAAAYHLTLALRARAAIWLPCEVTPSELARDHAGPPSALVGRVMRDPMHRDHVLNTLEREGITARYDRRRRTFYMRRR